MSVIGRAGANVGRGGGSGGDGERTRRRGDGPEETESPRAHMVGTPRTRTRSVKSR